MHWDITTDSKGSVLGGKDNYDFSTIHSTFVLDSAVLEWRSLSCTGSRFQPVQGIQRQLGNQLVWEFGTSSELARAGVPIYSR